MNELIARQPMLPTLGEFSPTSWTAPTDMTFEQWESAGQALLYMQGAINWWVGDWLNVGERKWGEEYAQAIEETGWKYQHLADSKWVAGKVDVSVRTEKLDWTHHSIVAHLEPDEQKDMLAWAVENEASVMDIKDEKRRRKMAATFESGDLEGLYSVFYADPPWQYGDSGVISESDNYGRAERHYETMSINELCDIGPDIKRVSADDSVLFLWVTSPIVSECFEVIEAWGFNYKASFIWDKVGHNYGHYNSVRHEILLVCTRGSYLPENGQLFDSVQSIEKSRTHSEKPEEFRQIIDTLYPSGDRIELFARQPVPGWKTWGDQAAG